MNGLLANPTANPMRKSDAQIRNGIEIAADALSYRQWRRFAKPQDPANSAYTPETWGQFRLRHGDQKEMSGEEGLAHFGAMQQIVSTAGQNLGNM
jgi:hypothetical protein